MTKNREKKGNTRAKKSKEKEKDRQLVRAREAVKFKVKRVTAFSKFAASPEIGTGTGYEFWLLHGMNFLLSSYIDGLWTPMFPEIYQGKTVPRTDVFKRLLKTHLDTTTNLLSPLGTKAILWASLKPPEMHALVLRARRLASDQKKNPMTEGQPDVWNFLHEVMGKFSSHLDEQKKTQGGSFQLPESYGEVLPQIVADTVANLSGVPTP